MAGREAVSSEVVARCAEGWIARARARAEGDRRRADGLRKRALALAERHGARRTWLFGSLAWGRPHSQSDVDILVEGLAATEWLSARLLAEETVGMPVDLVRLEEAPASLVERVRTEGVLLHQSP